MSMLKILKVGVSLLTTIRFKTLLTVNTISLHESNFVIPEWVPITLMQSKTLMKRNLPSINLIS